LIGLHYIDLMLLVHQYNFDTEKILTKFKEIIIILFTSYLLSILTTSRVERFDIILVRQLHYLFKIFLSFDVNCTLCGVPH